MKIRILVLSLFSLSACSADELAMSDRGSGPCDMVESVALSAEPAAIARGEAVEIAVSWALHNPDGYPVSVRLLTGQGYNVEVRVALVAEAIDEYPYTIYRGVLLNPFGLGLDAGWVAVDAEIDMPQGCSAPQVTSSIELQ